MTCSIVCCCHSDDVMSAHGRVVLWCETHERQVDEGNRCPVGLQEDLVEARNERWDVQREKELYSQIEQLRSETEGLREALEFYADPKANREYVCVGAHDRCFLGSGPECPYCEATPIPDFYDELDFGEYARAALGNPGK